MRINQVVAVSIMTGGIVGFQVVQATYLAGIGKYYMLVSPILAAGLGVAVITICFLSLPVRGRRNQPSETPGQR